MHLGNSLLTSILYFLTRDTLAVPCKPAPEVMYLHDASKSLSADAAALMSDFTQLTEALEDEYGQVRIGFASWIDKPLPYLGVGTRNTVEDIDYCYHLGTPITTDFSLVTDAMKSYPQGDGGDNWENPFEAILNGALGFDSNWTDSTYLKDGRKVVRIIVTVTDALPHSLGDAARAVAKYNQRWGTSELSGDIRAFPFDDGDARHKTSDYDRLVELYDLSKDRALTNDEKKQVEKLEYNFGPKAPWEQMNKPSRISNTTLQYCRETDYPSSAMAGQGLKDIDATLIMLLKEPPQVEENDSELCQSYYDIKPDGPNDTASLWECTRMAYMEAFALSRRPYHVQKYNGPTDLLRVLEETIKLVADDVCEITSTTTKSGASTTKHLRTTTAITTTTSKLTSFTKTTTSDWSSTTESDHSDNHTAAIIGGATAGAAGIIALGALIYRKVNGGFFTSGDANPRRDTYGEVSSGERSVDRENFEEVTTDMFQ